MSKTQNGSEKGFATSKAASQVSITLYQNGHAVVREVREVELGSGANRVLLEGLPTQYLPNTMKIRRVSGPGKFNPGGITIQPANLSLANVLAGYLNRKLTVLQANGGHQLRTTGKLVAVFGNQVAIEKEPGEAVLVVPTASEFEFPEGLPEGLSATSSVFMEPVVDVEGTYKLNTLYKTGGLNWSSHYTGFYNEKTGQFERLECTILLVNQSGIRFGDATLKLFASSNVSHAKSARGGGLRAMAAAAPMMESVMSFDAPAIETVGDQKMYTLDGAQTLENGQPKEAYLLVRENVPVVSELFVPLHASFYEQAEGDVKKVGCPIRLRLTNDEAHGLGLALPRGPLSVFEDDSTGEAQETNAGEVERDVAVAEEFVVNLSNPSSDVKYSRRLVDSKDDPEPEETAAVVAPAPRPAAAPRVVPVAMMSAAIDPPESAEVASEATDDAEPVEGPRYHYETRETVIHNFRKDRPADVIVYEQFPEGAEFTDASHEFATKGSTQGTYKVTVPAGEKVVVTHGLKWRIN